MNEKTKVVLIDKQVYQKPQTEVLALQVEHLLAGSDFDEGGSTITGDIDEMELEEG